MTGSDADILCGEWQTGPFPSEDSGEEYNIKLEILQVIQHPDFNTRPGGGPRLGSDIAVFIVDDSQLKEEMKKKKFLIRPACLPDSKPSSRDNAEMMMIHSGWNRPPPISLGQ